MRLSETEYLAAWREQIANARPLDAALVARSDLLDSRFCSSCGVRLMEAAIRAGEAQCPKCVRLGAELFCQSATRGNGHVAHGA